MKVDLSKLPETIVAHRTDAIYNCHSYLTKVPVGAIQPFIEHFTKKGDVVVDFFAGSGMTGLAAKMLKRKAKLSDISTLGQHIALGYLADVSEIEFREAGETVIKKAKQTIGNIYMTKRASDEKKVEMVRTVWSFTYVCPTCSTEIVYFEHFVIISDIIDPIRTI